MADPIRRALTRRRVQRGKMVSEEPNEQLVYMVKFAIAMLACLSAVEIAHIALMGAWNSEVFSAITGLVGTVMGIFVGKRGGD
jgi:hypothetical protein